MLDKIEIFLENHCPDGWKGRLFPIFNRASGWGNFLRPGYEYLKDASRPNISETLAYVLQDNPGTNTVLVELPDKVFFQVRGEDPLILDLSDHEHALRYIRAIRTSLNDPTRMTRILKGTEREPVNDIHLRAYLEHTAAETVKRIARQNRRDHTGKAHTDIYRRIQQDLNDFKVTRDERNHLVSEHTENKNNSTSNLIALKHGNTEKGQHILIKPMTPEERRYLSGCVLTSSQPNGFLREIADVQTRLAGEGAEDERDASLFQEHGFPSPIG